MCAHAHTYIHTFTHHLHTTYMQTTCSVTHTCARTHTRTHTHMHTHTHTHTCTHAHTHTHTPLLWSPTHIIVNLHPYSPMYYFMERAPTQCPQYSTRSVLGLQTLKRRTLLIGELPSVTPPAGTTHNNSSSCYVLSLIIQWTTTINSGFPNYASVEKKAFYSS